MEGKNESLYVQYFLFLQKNMYSTSSKIWFLYSNWQMAIEML